MTSGPPKYMLARYTEQVYPTSQCHPLLTRGLLLVELITYPFGVPDHPNDVALLGRM